MRLSRFEPSRDIGSQAVSPPTLVLTRENNWRPVLFGVGLLLLLVALAFAALAFVFSRPTVVADAAALARVDLPLTKGSIESVRVVGPHGGTIPVSVSDALETVSKRLVGVLEPANAVLPL